MKRFVFIALLLVTVSAAHAQLGGLLGKVKAKVNQRVDSKVDKAMATGL